MDKDIVFKCCVCENDFRPEALDKDGKCATCRVDFPTVKSKAEAMALNRPEIHLGKKIDEQTVRQIIKEELNEFKAVLKAEQKVDNMAKARAAKDDKKNDDNDGGKE